MMRTLLAMGMGLFVACGGSQDTAPTGPIGDETTTEETTADPPVQEPAGETYRRVAIDEVQWEPLDPQAGDKGPMVGALWGDRTSGPAGFLVKGPAGFPGAPHVHTADYRGVVISGEVYNDVPDAKSPLAMTPGANWSEPGGRAHITSCGAEGCMALVVFDGAMDLLPPDKTGTSPGGLTAANTQLSSLQWVNPPGTPEGDDSPIKLAFAWGDPTNGEPNGFFVKLKAGFPGAMHWHTSDYHAVVVQGTNLHSEPGGEVVESTPGSYWWQKGKSPHQDGCAEGEDCIVYVVMNGITDAHPAEGN